MYILVVPRGQRARPTIYPAIVLTTDNWNDYGYATQFFCRIVLDQDSTLELGWVKITRLGSADNGLDVGEEFPDGLSDDYAALGQDLDYYRRLATLEEVRRDEVLISLRDVTVDDGRLGRFQGDAVFQRSLLRASPARQALEMRRPGVRTAPRSDGGAYVYLPSRPAAITASLFTIGIGGVQGDVNVGPSQPKPEVATEETPPDSGAEEIAEASPPAIGEGAAKPSFSVTYTPSMAQSRFEAPLKFDFDDQKHLPGQMIVLVGPNGTGKTTFLANLARAAFEGADTAGGVLEAEPAVGRVVFVSYSALDTFKLPDAGATVGQWADSGYIYVGLRDLKAKDTIVLKSPTTQLKDFRDTLAALKQADTDKPRIAFRTAMARLTRDPSIAQALGIQPGAWAEVKDKALFKALSDGFEPLSTGHKAILNIVANLCGRLGPGSLLLMDEPEAHLHPPLIALLLAIVRDLLETFGSHAIIATHSPVVVQETPRRHVKIMGWQGSKVAMLTPDFETYGESLATITRKAFGLTAGDADYVARLENLAHADMKVDDIRQHFREGMSGSARSLLLQAIARKRAEGRKVKRAEQRKTKARKGSA